MAVSSVSVPSGQTHTAAGAPLVVTGPELSSVEAVKPAAGPWPPDLSQAHAASGSGPAQDHPAGGQPSSGNLAPACHTTDPSSTAGLYGRNFVLSLSANMVFMIGQSLSFNYSRYVVHLGGSDQTVGLITGASTAVVLLCRPWMGAWTDRLGTTRVWVWGLCLYAVACLANLAVTDIGAPLVALRVAWHIGWGLVFVCTTSYPAQIAPPHRRAEAIGAQGMGGFTGLLIGPLLGDWLFGLPAGQQFVALFGTSAGAALLAAVLVRQLVPVPAVARQPAPTVGGGPASPAGATWLAGLLDPPRHMIAHWPGPVVLIGLSLGMLFAVTMSFIARHADTLGTGGYGPFFVAYALAAIGVRLALPRLPQTLGRPGTILLGLLLGVGGYQTLGAVTVRIDYLWPGLLLGLCHGLVFPSMVDLAGDRFPPDRRALATSVILASQEAGMLMAAPAIGAIIQHLGFGALFDILSATLAVVITVFAAATVRAQRRAP